MGIAWEDAVLIERGSKKGNNKPGDPSVVTVNCPDKPGLGCDLCRIILEFGLCITRGDFSTDGRWCYIVLWVVPHPSLLRLDWESLKSRLLSVCPPFLIPFYSNHSVSSPAPIYLLKVFCLDRRELLHDVTKILSELDLTIQRVKVMTTPDGRVLDLFFITDGMELLHTQERRDNTCTELISVLGEYCISCDLQLAGPEYENQCRFSLLSPTVAEELFSCKLQDHDACMQAISKDITTPKKAVITVDNSLSPAHTLLQIQCVDQKGLFFDILRTSKDCEIQIAHGRICSSVKGYRSMDLLIQHTDGKKILDTAMQTALCSRLKEAILHPLRVTIANRGPDTELLVANPVELSGKGRPRVFYDVTVALKTLGICIFLAEISRHSTSNQQWEVYRFLLDENCESLLSSSKVRTRIVDTVKRTLMGW